MDKDYSYFEEIELKPCPCCGSEDVPDLVIRAGSDETKEQFTVFCDPHKGGCGAHVMIAGHTVWYDAPDKAAKAWNESNKENLIRTNRQWMESLSDEKLAYFCSTGLYLKRKNDGSKASIRLSGIAKRGSSPIITLERWFNEPQEFDIVI